MNRLKIGDVLWRMEGREKNGKTVWHPIPMCIEHIDEHKFLDGWGCGGSWNSIGKNYFLTRDECLKDYSTWKKHRDILGDLPKKTAPELGDIVKDDTLIWEDGNIVMVFYGLARERFPVDKIPWNQDPNTDYGVWEVTTLGEIREAVLREYHTEFVTVWVEDLLHGVIYECGNYTDNKFRFHGETNGYA